MLPLVSSESMVHRLGQLSHKQFGLREFGPHDAPEQRPRETSAQILLLFLADSTAGKARPSSPLLANFLAMIKPLRPVSRCARARQEVSQNITVVMTEAEKCDNSS